MEYISLILRASITCTVTFHNYSTEMQYRILSYINAIKFAGSYLYTSVTNNAWLNAAVILTSNYSALL